MPNPHLRLTAALTVAAAAMFSVYLTSKHALPLVFSIISAFADLISIISAFIGSKEKVLEGWADDLAVQVARAWSHRKRILLGGSTGLATAFSRAEDLEADVRHVRFRQGNWFDVDQLFLQIPTQKLVILGAAGSGKTLLMLQIVTGLLELRRTRRKTASVLAELFTWLRRSAGDEAENENAVISSDGIPVPISVVGWDGQAPLNNWLISRLRNAYNLPKRRARALVADGYILPVLDGLDEVADVANPVPMMRILNHLNFDYGAQDERGSHPVVVTCRTEAYAELPDPEDDESLSRRVTEAPVIVMRPLTNEEVLDFLQNRARSRSRRINRLIEFLKMEGTASVVMEAMRSPLVTSLAIRSSTGKRINYGELSSFTTEEEVRNYFISVFITSTVAAFPKAYGRRSVRQREQSQDISRALKNKYYDEYTTEEWLFQVAEFITKSTSRPSDSAKAHLNDLWSVLRSQQEARTTIGSVSAAIVAKYKGEEGVTQLPHPELRPQDLWKVAQSAGKPVHKIHFWLAILVTLLTGTFGAEIADGVNGFIGWAATTFLAGLFALRISRPTTPGLSRADFRQLAKRRTAVFLVPIVALTGALAGALAYYVSHQISVAITEGIAGAAGATLLAGLSRGLARAVEPLDGLRNDLKFGIIVGIVGAIAIGFPGGLTGGLWSHLHLNSLLTKPGSQALAFVLAIPCGIVLGSGGWVRVQIAALVSGGRPMPRRPIAFLQWAEATGLLRAVGTSYQFRHDDLRIWLIRHRPRLVTGPADPPRGQ